MGCAVAVTALAPSPVNAAADTLRTYYCEITTTNSIDGKTRSETAKVWMKGPIKFRLENSRGTSKTVYIGNGPDVWQLSVGRKTGIRLKQTPAALARMRQQDRPIGVEYWQFLKMGGKKSGRENQNGQLCDVYTLSKSGATAKLWVIVGPEKLTRRKEVTRILDAALRVGQPMSKHTITIVQSYDNWQVNKPIDDSMFRPPAGYRITQPPARKR